MRKLLPKIPANLVKAYENRKITIKELAEKTGRSVPCAFQHLVRQGYRPRARKALYELTKDQYNSYIKGEKSAETLAEEIGCSYPNVRNLLRRSGYGRYQKDYTERRKAAREKRVEKTFESYVRGKTLGDVADKLSLSRQRVQQMIANYLEKKGVKLAPNDCLYRCSECKKFLIIRSYSRPTKVICGNCCRDRLGPLAEEDQCLQQ